MKTSVLIIAHNEEKNIVACLAAVFAQSIQPDEVVVIAHNCTDRTEEIVRSFSSVRLMSYQGPVGSVYARIKGFEEVKGDIVVCLDADAVPVGPDWLENITAPFADPGVAAVGGEVMLVNNLYTRLIAKSFFNFSKYWRRDYHFYFWGANFAVRKLVYEHVGGLRPLISLAKKLSLNYVADDLYLSLALEKAGKVVCTPRAGVTTYIPWHGYLATRRRFFAHNRDSKILFKHFEV